jgi:hypothetical protein
MKTRYVIAFFAIVISTSCLAQNKTLGVGAATPNANAALHVESPTNNQGFIMPRLTTAQRTAMAGLPLTTADDGLMVYDKDTKKIYIWDGAAWQLAAGLNLPFASSTASASPALEITNTGTSNAGLFRISNPGNSNPALSSITDGTGLALALNVTNASNSGAALSIVHAGTGNAISTNAPIQATQFIGDGSLLTNLPAFALPFTGLTGAASTAFQVTHTGTGHTAGDFRIQNTSSSASALRAQSDGSGAAFTATNIGTTGFAANFDNTDATNPSATVFAVNNGTGPVAVITQTNASNISPALSISSAGSGPSITATGSIEALQFVGDGSGLSGITVPDVSITAANESVSIGKSAGTSFQGVSIGDQVGGGGSGNVFIGKSAGIANTGNNNLFAGWQAGMSNFDGNNNIFIGPGAGGGVTSGVSQTTGDNIVLIGTHADIGATPGINNAVAIGEGAVVNASNAIVLGNSSTNVGIGFSAPTARLDVRNTNGSTNAAYFSINNGANAAPGVLTQTNGTGPALQANQSNNGIAVDIVSGTMKHSTFTTAGTTITTRAGVYNLTGAGTYSLPTAGVVDGEVCIVYNSNAGSITVESVLMAAGIVHQFVRIGAAWRRVQ